LDVRWEEGLYNAAPTRQLPVVRMEDGKSFVQPMRWGFVPTWWKEDKLPTSTTNARIETIVTKPMWRSAIRHSRALVPARGYYEWTQASQPKQPYFIRLLDEPLTCFAGLCLSGAIRRASRFWWGLPRRTSRISTIVCR
jgi:putative SOS response-associated peptidase YedK